ncbi:MAG: ACT domain-containing protein [Clostridiales bacterium]|nr:ACT domain-containing protein [Clostridiales bacterium]
MVIVPLPYELSVCQLHSAADLPLTEDFCFIGKTHDELSLVCKTDAVPAQTINREDGWKCFYIEGTLDFSLIGILSEISTILAKEDIGIFAVSTYNTDYILTKEDDFALALTLLSVNGYSIKQL